MSFNFESGLKDIAGFYESGGFRTKLFGKQTTERNLFIAQELSKALGVIVFPPFTVLEGMIRWKFHIPQPLYRAISGETAASINKIFSDANLNDIITASSNRRVEGYDEIDLTFDSENAETEVDGIGCTGIGRT